MALRYDLSESGLNLRPGCSNLPSWASRDPVAVSYDKSMDAGSTAREVLSYSVVDIHAPVGAGKSTVLPRAIAAESNILVYMVVPSQLMAIQIYDYVTSHPVLSKDGVSSYLCEDITKPLPSNGVVYLSGSTMMGLVFRQGGPSTIIGRIVFLDEAHEVDCYSYVLKNLSTQMGAKHLVRASATLQEECTETFQDDREDVAERKYDASHIPQTWDLTDSTKPWYCKQQGNTLVFTDSDEAAQVLLEKYEQQGYIAYRLTSKTTGEKFRAVLARLKTPQAVVLIADYTFRSGFTFNVTNVIDTSRVHYKSSVPGVNEMRVRSATLSEIAQARGRVGRIPGLPATYSRADVPVLDKRVGLAGVEAEAAAYLYRILGFKPSRRLARRVMAKMDLPYDITMEEAFNGSKPLTCYNLIEVLPDERSASFRSKRFARKVEKVLVPVEDPIRRKPPELIEGEFYYAPSMPACIEASRSNKFPDGYKSVSEFLKTEGTDTSIGTLTCDERLYAVAVSLRKYNENVLRAAAMKSALAEVCDERAADVHKPGVQLLVDRIKGDIEYVELLRASQFADVSKLVLRFLRLESCEGAHDLIVERARLYYDAYIGSVNATIARAILPTYFEATSLEAQSSCVSDFPSSFCSVSGASSETSDHFVDASGFPFDVATDFESSGSPRKAKCFSISSEDESSTSSEGINTLRVAKKRSLCKPRIVPKAVSIHVGRVSRIRVAVPNSYVWSDAIT